MNDAFIDFDRSSFSDKVYSAILELLINLRFKPGEKISEESVAALLGVSRTPVREALRRLAADGLVDIFPRRGVYAKEITARDILELYEIRMCLEIQAARQTIGAVPEDHINFVNNLIEECLSKEGVAFIEAEIRLDREIHRTINSFCGNDRLRSMLEKIDHLAKFMRVVHANKEEVVRDNFREHVNIWKALAGNNEPEMVRLLTEHLTNRQRCLLQDFNMMQADGRRKNNAAVRT